MGLGSVWNLFKGSGPDASSAVGAAGPYTLNDAQETADAATGQPMLSEEEASEFKDLKFGKETAVQGSYWCWPLNKRNRNGVPILR